MNSEGCLDFFMTKIVLPACIIAAGIGSFLLIWIVISLFRGSNKSIPVPLDMCRGTQLHVVEQANIVTQDYIDLRGNTVYLVWKAPGLFDPELKSKQVIPGDLCHS